MATIQPGLGVGEGVGVAVISTLTSTDLEMVPIEPVTLRVNVPVVAEPPAEI